VVPLLAGGGQAPEPGAVFPSEVSYVEVDVFVADAQGNAVRGLTRDEVQIFEEGGRQEIAAFTEVALPEDRVDPMSRGETPLPPDVATNEGELDGRIYAIVLDDAHTDRRRSAPVREAAREFITRHMASHDVAAVVHATAGAPAAFTRNKAVLLESVARFTGRKARSAVLERMSAIDHQRDLLRQSPADPLEAALVPRPGPDTDPSDAARAHDAWRSMATLESVVRALGDVRGRRKAILFFSEGVDYDTFDVARNVQRQASDVSSSLQRAIAAATWNNVAVYPIDPRGLGGARGSDDMEMGAPPGDRTLGIDSQSLDRERRQSQQSLRLLATQTGGIAALDTNDFATAFETIVRASSHYYLVGYHPADFRPDGAYRRLEVRVARPGASVLARNGYVRPRRDGPKEERAEVAAAGGTSAELRELLESAWPRPGLTLGVTAAVFKVTAQTATVAVAVEVAGRALPFRRENDRAVNDVEVSLLVLDEAGRARGGDRLLAAPRLTAQTHERVQRAGLRFVRRLDLAPGRYQLRVAARETEEGRRGSVFYDLQVPDFGQEDLAISGVLLTSHAAALALTPSPDEVVKALLDTPPTAARTFATNDVLTAYAEVYDALEPAHDLSVATRVATPDGREVFRTADQRASSALRAEGGGLRLKVGIPLAPLSPGSYRLRIEAIPTVGARRVARELSFQVVAHAGAASPDLPPPPTAGAGPPGAAARSASRIDRLEAWLAAAEGHTPGTPDGAASLVRAWGPAKLMELATDVAVATALIGDPNHPVLWLVDPARPGRPQRAPYTLDDERRLRTLARDAADRCRQDALLKHDANPRRNAQRCVNRLLKRGAVLHTDAAILFGDGTARPGAGPDAQRWRVRFTDGRPLGTEGTAGQLELVQALLDNVAPNPAADPTVRLWYIATSAYGQYHERHTRHEDRAVQIFPEDADVQFLAGSLHETFASPRIQTLARSVRLPAGAAHGIGSEQAELRQAEERFRRALERQPAFTEARIRLGRVLHLRGRHEQAARELQQAVTALSSGRSMAADDGLLGYYAEMFLGAAAESLGRHELARSSYTRAAALYPGAPSPRLALSRLALSGSDRAAALAALREALQPGHEDRDDPLWRYHVVQGRGADAWLARLHESLAVEP
jgi:VWFA-related protein